MKFRVICMLLLLLILGTIALLTQDSNSTPTPSAPSDTIKL